MSLSTHGRGGAQVEKKISGDDISADAAVGYGNGQPPAGVQVPKDAAPKLRTRTFREFKKTAAGKALSSRDREVLEQLLNYGNNERAHWISSSKLVVTCYPCIETIAADIGKQSAKPIRAALNNLRDAGLVDWTRTGRGNLYQITLPLCEIDRGGQGDQSAQTVRSDSAKQSDQIVPNGPIALEEGTSTKNPCNKPPLPTTPRERSAPAAASSVDSGGGGEVFCSGDEAERKISEMQAWLESEGIWPDTAIMRATQLAGVIELDVLKLQRADCNSAEKPHGAFVKRLQLLAENPGHRESVIGAHTAQKNKQGAFLQGILDECQRQRRSEITPLAKQRARQQLAGLSDQALWFRWRSEVNPHVKPTPEALQKVRHEIMSDSVDDLIRKWPRFRTVFTKQLDYLEKQGDEATIEQLRALPIPTTPAALQQQAGEALQKFIDAEKERAATPAAVWRRAPVTPAESEKIIDAQSVELAMATGGAQ